jgi:hypothetical protein
MHCAASSDSEVEGQLLTLIQKSDVYDILKELIALAFSKESLGERRADSDLESPDLDGL